MKMVSPKTNFKYFYMTELYDSSSQNFIEIFLSKHELSYLSINFIWFTAGKFFSFFVPLGITQ